MSGALPDYLRGLSEADHYYGELSHDPRTGRWVIKGEPCVCALARKVLPGCESRRRGYVRFNANKRVIGELNWLMQRYPLRVGPRSAARWASCMEEARRHALFVERMRTSDERQKAHPIYFNGELLPFQERGLSYLCNVDRCLLA
ncbi:MAG: hypothetical protein FWE70_08770, partial [Oscillospiraceae bacterium]|nr:hypothetical protein [Oscillospiraceae bacterium]